MSLLIVLWILLSLLIGYAGRHRRIGFLGFFFGSLLMALFLSPLLSPIPALVATTLFCFIVLLITGPKNRAARG
ncbi:MAG: hypothetical protein KGN76_11895 [Acidobacteriota bacterium]|nr:hypothetical protein [Acidobacteriota bacterium]